MPGTFAYVAICVSCKLLFSFLQLHDIGDDLADDADVGGVGIAGEVGLAFLGALWSKVISEIIQNIAAAIVSLVTAYQVVKHNDKQK